MTFEPGTQLSKPYTLNPKPFSLKPNSDVPRRENATLTFLDLSWNHLRPQDLKVLCPSVAESATIRALSLAWNGIGGEEGSSSSSSSPPKVKGGATSGAAALVDMIKRTRSLTELDISNCRLGAASCGELAAALDSNSTLEDFVMDGNPLGLEAMQVGKPLILGFRV